MTLKIKETYMKHSTPFVRIFSLLLLVAISLPILVSCKDEPATEEGFPLEQFKIVRSDGEDGAAAVYTAKLKSALEAKTGVSLSVITDETPESGEKEILIGQTNRAA